MSLRVLIAGEVVGKAGIIAIKSFLSSFRARRGIDFVISGNNFTTGLRGLGQEACLFIEKVWS